MPAALRRGRSSASVAGADGEASGKKRRVSARQDDQALATLLTSGTQSDMGFIFEKLEEKQELVPKIASWLRDGKLERALQKMSEKPANDEKFAETCFYMSHVGVKVIKTWLGKWNADYEADALADRDIKLTWKDAQKCLQFALGVHLHCWLPDLKIAATETALQTRYEHAGRRLQGVPANTDWQKAGYFGFKDGDMQTIVCLVDTVQPRRSVTLPLSHEQMSAHGDWKFVNSWSRDAYLQSQSADVEYKLASRFEKQFPEQWQRFLPYELESFEPDGVSAPRSFVDIGVRGRNVKKGKARSLRALSVSAAANGGGNNAAASSATPAARAPPPGNGGRRVAAAPRT